MGSKINVFNVFDFLIISTYMYKYLTFHYTQLTKIKDFNVFFYFNLMIRTYVTRHETLGPNAAFAKQRIDVINIARF